MSSNEMLVGQMTQWPEHIVMQDVWTVPGMVGWVLAPGYRDRVAALRKDWIVPSACPALRIIAEFCRRNIVIPDDVLVMNRERFR